MALTDKEIEEMGWTATGYDDSGSATGWDYTGGTEDATTAPTTSSTSSIIPPYETPASPEQTSSPTTASAFTQAAKPTTTRSITSSSGSSSSSWTAPWEYQPMAGGTYTGVSATGQTVSGLGKVTTETPVLDLPEFTAPEYDEAAEAAKTQAYSASAINTMREQLMKARMSAIRTPGGSSTLADALEGYGKGLGELMTESRKQAEDAITEQYNRDYDKARMEYDITAREEESLFNTAMAMYQQGGYQQKTVL